eukprot:UN26459
MSTFNTNRESFPVFQSLNEILKILIVSNPLLPNPRKEQIFFRKKSYVFSQILDIISTLFINIV